MTFTQKPKASHFFNFQALLLNPQIDNVRDAGEHIMIIVINNKFCVMTFMLEMTHQCIFKIIASEKYSEIIWPKEEQKLCLANEEKSLFIFSVCCYQTFLNYLYQYFLY